MFRYLYSNYKEKSLKTFDSNIDQHQNNLLKIVNKYRTKACPVPSPQIMLQSVKNASILLTSPGDSYTHLNQASTDLIYFPNQSQLHSWALFILFPLPLFEMYENTDCSKIQLIINNANQVNSNGEKGNNISIMWKLFGSQIIFLVEWSQNSNRPTTFSRKGKSLQFDACQVLFHLCIKKTSSAPRAPSPEIHTINLTWFLAKNRLHFTLFPL